MNNTEALMTTDDQTRHYPAFVEAEKMFERIANITRDTAARAYNFFASRGGELGDQVEDWLRAEMETLRAAPAKITETKDKVNVRIAAPGFKPNEIEISIKGPVLMVSGESTDEEISDNEDTYYNEWRSDRFMRQLVLPSLVETENVEALLKDGVLTLNLKKKEAENASKVAVKTA